MKPSILLAGIIYIAIIIFPLLVKEIKTAIRQEKVMKILLNEFKKKQTQALTILAPFL
jgi:hypothetical protein